MRYRCLSAAFVAASGRDIDQGLNACTRLRENYNRSARCVLGLAGSLGGLDYLCLRYLQTGGDDARCHYMLFANTTYLARNRSEEALETANWLKESWQTTQQRFREIFCPIQDTACEWDYLGKLRQYFESLDHFLSKFYDALIAAINKAAEKMSQEEVPEHSSDACTPVNIGVLGCELDRTGKFLGQGCNNESIKIPSRCDGQSWPVGYVRELSTECWWPAVARRYHNFSKIRTFASFLASRLPYLIIAQGLCGGRLPHDRTARNVMMPIDETAGNSLRQAARVYLTTAGPKLVNDAADAYGVVGWPAMENDTKKYEQLATKIEEYFKRDYEMKE